MNLVRKALPIVTSLSLLAGITFQANSALIDVSEINDFSSIYGLNVAVNSNYGGAITVGYDIDNSASTGLGTIDRVAYYLELDSSWIWVSFDALTQDFSKIGVPVDDILWDQQISNMKVESNVAGVTTGVFATGGNIEFFSSCYAGTADSAGAGITGGNSSTFDFDDQPYDPNCYGSMQIHNFTLGDTLFAFNAWSEADTDEVGIGTRGTDNPDWTFARNSGDFTTRRLEVFVSSSTIRSQVSVPEPSTFGLLGLGIVGLLFRRKAA